MIDKRIAELRREHNISQEQLAEILNTSRQAVSKWERGEAYPDIDKLKDLAIFFNVSIDYLLDYDIEATSINNFIDQIKKCIETKIYDIDNDEIKMMITKNSNNFELLIAVIDYYVHYACNKHSNELFDTLLEYCNKAIIIYREDNKMNVKVNDIKGIIVVCYIIQGRDDLAKQFIKDNDMNDCEYYLAECEYNLGNNDESLDLSSKIFLDSITQIINSTMLQSRILLRKNDVIEAYNLVNWSISFIKSIGKKEDLFKETIYLLSFIKAICEKNLGYSFQETVKYLKDNYNDFYTNSDTKDIKFYYNENDTILSLLGEMKTFIEKEIKKLEGSNCYKDALFIYNEVINNK